MRKSILLVHNYFYPAKLAGGPVVSCRALTQALKDNYDFYVFTRSVDLDGSVLPVVLDQWVDVDGIWVRYCNADWGFWGLRRILNEVNPDVVYINGIYSLVSTIYPLILAQTGMRVILCPRGMLMDAARAQKKWRKRLFLLLFSRLFRKKLTWHLTSSDELDELPENLLHNLRQTVAVIPNLPLLSEEGPLLRRNDPGALRVLTVALVGPMKNIHKGLAALQRCEAKIEYRLFGPIIDPGYWEECQVFISCLPDNVDFKYMGPIDYDRIADEMNVSDLFLLPSKSENFGHSIVEALFCGLPVVTSNNVPWNGLSEAGCGINVEPSDIDTMAKFIDSYCNVTSTQRIKVSERARAYIKGRINMAQVAAEYCELFDHG